MSHLYFNEKSDHSEENTCDNEVFLSTIHDSAVDLLHCKNEAREIDCLCRREVDAMLIASAQIAERKGTILPSSLHEHLSDY